MSKKPSVRKNSKTKTKDIIDPEPEVKEVAMDVDGVS